MIEEIVTLEFPVFVIVTVCAGDEAPVVTLPKFKLVGLMPSVYVAATAEPLRLTEAGEAGALLTIEMLPDTVPADAGLKATLTVARWPAVTLNGNENPLTLNAAPVTLIWVIFRAAVPVLVMIKA